MKKVVLIFLIGVASIAINWLSLLIGWWLVTSLMGLMIGLVIRPRRVALLVAWCVGALSWGLPLGVLAISSPVGQVAAAVESMLGLSTIHGVVIVLTIMLGCLLSITGWWIGVASQQLSGAFALRHWRRSA